MPFISPMLASPLPANFDLKPLEWCAEQKYDGHRLIVEKRAEPSDLFCENTVLAWSRYGLPRILPRHVREAIGVLPDGIYDGELVVPGERSYGVTELTKTDKLIFVCFDLLTLFNQTTTDLSYTSRRQFLVEMFSRKHVQEVEQGLRLAESYSLNSLAHAMILREKIWKQGGEGLILKRCNATYRPGKRTKDFLKIKALRTAVLRVVGFLPSVGQIQNRGPFGIVVLQDDEGNQVTVKTRNDHEIAMLEQHAVLYLGQIHPDIGRKLRIEYQERTPDGSYRHPRWDRFEDE